MSKNRLLGMLAVAVLLLSACSKDKEEVGPSFTPGINELPADMQEWVRKYPGEVRGDIPRMGDTLVEISGTYTVIDQDLTQVMPLYWQSSGLYVPPAEEITVDVPTGVSGLKYQIGIATVQLTSTTQKERYHKVDQNGNLNPGLNTLKSTFGGPLYFYFEGAPSGNTTVKVSGAIKSNDFVSGKTSVAEWRKDLANSPWSELIGKRVIFTLPAATLAKIENPQAFLDFYDEFIEKDIEVLQAVTPGQITMPWRIYADVQLPATGTQKMPALRTSYPMAFITKQMEEAVVGSPQLEGAQMVNWLKGIAELYNIRLYSEEMTPIVEEMFYWHLMQRKGQWDKIGVEMALPKKEGERYWMARENSRRTMYLQLLQQYGWGMVVYTKKRSNEEIRGEIPEQYNNDLLIIYTSEYTSTDLYDFFRDWDFPASMFAQQYMKHYPSLSERFWDLPDNTKQPAQSSEIPAGVAYEKIIPTFDTIYRQSSNWSVTASSESVSTNGNGRASCLVDGKPDTYYQSASNPGYPHTISCAFRDEQDEPIELEFNYLRFVQQDYTKPAPKAFRIEIKTVPDGEDWAEIEDGKTFYLERDYDTARGDIYQIRFLSNSFKSFGVRLVFISSLPGHEGSNDVADYMTLSEMELGLLK